MRWSEHGLSDLPQDPGADELARDWTLSEADQAQAFLCRGERNRLWFAAQLLVLSRTGRFLEGELAPGLLNHVCVQLECEPVLFLPAPDRAATEADLRQRIRDYLGRKPFDSVEREPLERWLAARATEGCEAQELLARAEAMLWSRGVVLPERRGLQQMVAVALAAARRGFLEELASRISPALGEALDALLETSPGARSLFAQLKEPAPAPRAGEIRERLERYQLVRALPLDELDWSGVPREAVREVALRVRRYDARAMRRFEAGKRRAMMACFVAEQGKTLLDQVVEMNDRYLTDMQRTSRNHDLRRAREARRRYQRDLQTVLKAGRIVARGDCSWESRGAELEREIGMDDYSRALDGCEGFLRADGGGFLKEMANRYTHLRRYLPAFLALPFQGEAGTEPLLQALEISRKLDAGDLKELPEDAPIGFVPKSWKDEDLWGQDRTTRRRLWEIALAQAVKSGLRSGDLYLPESRRHVAFYSLVYDESRWVQERPTAYADLSLPSEADRALDRLRQEYEDAVRDFTAGLASNPYASISKDRLRFKREAGEEPSEQVAELRRTLEAHLQRIRIEDMLYEVDSWCGFTEEFQPPADYQPRTAPDMPTLMAALVAHGTNLGISAMGQSADGITVDMLAHASRWYIREETLKEANARLVNYHHHLPQSRLWGQGTGSSSDGQRFGVDARILPGAFYPRYFGYYERALTVYTHYSDQHALYSTQVISCADREAVYVLEGLLDHHTDLPLVQHTTDTHGYTEHLFGLCWLLGFDFVPRIKDLGKQQLYKLDRERDYGPLDPVFRGSVDLDLIREQWDQLVRVAASLRNRTAPAHVVMHRLAASGTADRLAKALTALSRIRKTIHVLTWGS